MRGNLLKIVKKSAPAAGILASAFLFVAASLAATTSMLFPGANGNYTQWTPSTGTNHAALVDETPCNGNTDYNFTTTVGNRDSYTTDLSSVPNGSVITKIDIAPCVSRQVSGGTNPVMNVFYRLNGANSADAGSYTLTLTTPAKLATTSYSGLSIVKGSTTALEVGAVLTSGTKGARLSNVATVLTYTLLDAPSGLSSTNISFTENDLSWTDNSTVEDGFKVERRLGTGPFINIATTTASISTYQDTTASAGNTYGYRVRAYNAGGNSAYTDVSTTTVPEMLPNAPNTLVGYDISATENDLTWVDKSIVEDGFAVERNVDGGSYVNIATTTANVTSYQDFTVTRGHTYKYRVRAFNSYGYSGYTFVYTITKILETPTGLSATNISSTENDLSWTDNSTSEDGFKIERRLSGGTFTNIATTTVDVTSYQDMTVSSGNTYNYRIRAYTSGGNSSYSNTVTTTVP